MLPRPFRQNNFLKSPQSTLYGKSSYFRVELFKFRFITSRSFTRGSYYEKKLGGSKTRTRWKQESWARFPGGVVAASRQFSPGARPGHIAARRAVTPNLSERPDNGSESERCVWLRYVKWYAVTCGRTADRGRTRPDSCSGVGPTWIDVLILLVVGFLFNSLN